MTKILFIPRELKIAKYKVHIKTPPNQATKTCQNNTVELICSTIYSPVKPVVVNADTISKYNEWASKVGNSFSNGSIKKIGKIKKLDITISNWLRIGEDFALFKLATAKKNEISNINKP